MLYNGAIPLEDEKHIYDYALKSGDVFDLYTKKIECYVKTGGWMECVVYGEETDDLLRIKQQILSKLDYPIIK